MEGGGIVRRKSRGEDAFPTRSRRTEKHSQYLCFGRGLKEKGSGWIS